MRRREVILALGGAAASIAWPLALRAQQPAKVARIGCLVTGSLESPETRVMLDAFRQGLRERGYVEGQKHRHRIPIGGWEHRAIPASGG